MLLRNLLKSWSQLQPEVAIFENEDIFGIKIGTNSIEFVHLPCRDTNMEWLKSQKIKLLALLIDIAENNKLNYEINSYLWEYENELRREYKVNLSPSSPRSFIFASNNLIESFLWVYVESLALQRNIVAGQWQHFKPATPVCNVVAIASHHKNFSFGETKPEVVDQTLYVLEDEPSKSLRLIKVKGQNYYVADKDYGDLVFYHYDGDKQWAIEKSNFLGLVGPEHPESEGLLKFLKHEN